MKVGLWRGFPTALVVPVGSRASRKLFRLPDPDFVTAGKIETTVADLHACDARLPSYHRKEFEKKSPVGVVKPILVRGEG